MFLQKRSDLGHIAPSLRMRGKEVPGPRDGSHGVLLQCQESGSDQCGVQGGRLYLRCETEETTAYVYWWVAFTLSFLILVWTIYGGLIVSYSWQLESRQNLYQEF